MTIARVVIACVVFAIFSQRTLAQSAVPDSAPSTRPAQFDALAAQLGSSNAKVRDAAQASIVKLGDAAIPAVEELAAKAEDAEVKARAEAILRQIAAASVTRPTLVTLNFKKAAASDVYAELFKQAKAKLEIWPPELFDQQRGPLAIRPVTVNLKNVPFWTAMIELEKQTGLFFDDVEEDMRLTDVVQRGQRLASGDVSINGPFLVLADATFGPTIQQLKVFVEPRIRVLAHAREPVIVEAVDVNGEPVDAEAPLGMRLAEKIVGLRGARLELDEFGGNAFDLLLWTPVPRAGRLRGTARVVVMTEQEVVEIDGVAKANNVERNIAARRVLFNVMNPAPAEWYLTLMAFKAAAGAGAPNAVGLNKTQIEMLDAQGNPLGSSEHHMQAGDNRVVFNQEFKQGPNVGPPAKLRMTIAKATREVDVPFAFGEKAAAAAPAEEPAPEAAK